VLIGAMFLRERLSGPEIAGMLLILIGVATVILSRTRTQQGGAVPPDLTLEAEA
jgi:drug/metabolite transporter (DMT)-like permease